MLDDAMRADRPLKACSWLLGGAFLVVEGAGGSCPVLGRERWVSVVARARLAEVRSWGKDSRVVLSLIAGWFF